MWKRSPGLGLTGWIGVNAPGWTVGDQETGRREAHGSADCRPRTAGGLGEGLGLEEIPVPTATCRAVTACDLLQSTGEKWWAFCCGVTWKGVFSVSTWKITDFLMGGEILLLLVTGSSYLDFKIHLSCPVIYCDLIASLCPANFREPCPFHIMFPFP